MKKTPLFFMFPATTSKNNAGITNLESETNKEQCYRLVFTKKIHTYLSILLIRFGLYL